MRLRLLPSVLIGTCWFAFVLAIGWPTVALVAKSVVQGEPPADGFTISSRQLGLLGRSCGLAVLATVASLIISLPGAYVLGEARRLSSRPVITAALAAQLLCPPMVYAFGWEKLLPAEFNSHLRCIGVWALWAWPVPAALIGTGWSRVGRHTYEAALMVASPSVAFFRIALPLMLKYVALGGLILFVLFFGDYGVPHACGLRVYPTELLGWAASSSLTIDTAWPALPGVGVTAVALAGMFLAWRYCAAAQEGEVPVETHPASSRRLSLIALGAFAVSCVLPVGTLVVELGSLDTMRDALMVYGEDLAWSLGVALTAGAAVLAMGLGIAAVPYLRAAGLAWAVAFGALPGALIGESLVAAYNRAGLWWLYDYWPIVALSYVARFGWVGVLAALAMTSSSGSRLAAQARTDGATSTGILAHIHIPANWPTILCGVAIVAALSLADVTACTLVRVPSFAPVGLVLIEKFHRFEDGMLISLSLWLGMATLPAGLLLLMVLRRSGPSTAFHKFHD